MKHSAKKLKLLDLMKLLMISVLLLTAGKVSAFTIDDFSSGHVEFPGIFATGPGATAQGTQTGTMLGGRRHILLEMLASTATTFVTVPLASDDFVITNGTTEITRVTVTWAGMTAPVDMTVGGTADGMEFVLVSSDPNPMTVTLLL